MKYKHLIIFTLILLSVHISVNAYRSFSTGAKFTKQDKEAYRLKIIDSIAERYFLEIGSPKTINQHCVFVKVVYGDYDECNY